MRGKITLFFCFVLYQVVGQISISTGVNRRMENVLGGNTNPFISFKTNDSRFKNDYFNIKVEYQKTWLLLSSEIGFLNKKEVVSDIYFNDPYSVPFNPTTYYYKVYTKVDYSYLNLRFVPSYLFEGTGVIFKKTKSGLGVGPFVQADFLLNHLEHNQSEENPEFDAVKLKAILISYGLRLVRRITFKGVFIEANGSIGWSAKNRTIFYTNNSLDFNTYSNFFYELGISLGYTIPCKIKNLE